MFNFDNAEFFYDPFPIGRAPGVIDSAMYKELVDSFPPIELFGHKVNEKDDKYYFNETKTRDSYLDWIRNHAAWREMHRWIKSPDFAYSILDMLAARNVDLGIRRQRPSLYRQARRVLGDLKRRRQPRFERSVYSRFEFSILSADGGFICPHTDAPNKIITLVCSMVPEGYWDPAIGGALEVNRPVQQIHSYNHINHFLTFDEVEPIRDFQFVPNQCVIFVKTFNSYHCVRPMRASGSSLERRTITIVIEYE